MILIYINKGFFGVFFLCFGMIVVEKYCLIVGIINNFFFGNLIDLENICRIVIGFEELMIWVLLIMKFLYFLEFSV